jgi:hypothetical protein
MDLSIFSSSHSLHRFIHFFIIPFTPWIYPFFHHPIHAMDLSIFSSSHSRHGFIHFFIIPFTPWIYPFFHHPIHAMDLSMDKPMKNQSMGINP